ncbi:MAG: helix-turn-helix domain-containing protein [Verrucomicrobia bacterium]|nr:helix-turn-helix domain-containing protein [Verrucomicrobiota bacterium]
MKSILSQPTMRQSEWATMSLSLQWVYEGTIPDDGHGRRKNANLAAWLLLEGEARVRMEDGAEASAGPGEWILLPGGERVQEFSEDARIFSLCWCAFWPDGRNLFNHGLPVTLSASAHPLLETTARELFEFQQEYLADKKTFFVRSRGVMQIGLQAYLKLEYLLIRWLDQVTAALESVGVVPATHEIPDERVLLALELLERDPLRRRVSVSNVAKAVGLSISQLDRLFTQHVGHTPKAHLQARKLSEARNLLEEGDLPMKQISYRLGFSSPNAFYNWFKKETGKSPSSVKKSGR